MKPAGKQKAYVHAQSEIEETVNTVALANGFAMVSRNPNYGKGSSIAWSRQLQWRTDELRILFMWQGRPGYRGVYADVGTRIILPERSCAVDGYPAAWIARGSSHELRIKESDAHAPAAVLETLRSDIIAAIAWLGRTYSTPASAAARLMSEDRNGVGAGTPLHKAVLAHLERIAVLNQDDREA